MAGRSSISLDEMPEHVPYRLIFANPELGWDGVAVRRWGALEPGQIEDGARLVPLALLAHSRGSARVHRQMAGRWMSDILGAGDLSILSPGVEADWRWDDPLHATHVYLTEDLLASIGRSMYQQEVEHVEMRDTLRFRDAAIFRAVALIADEAAYPSVGGRLLVDSLATELAVRLLRGYSNVRFKEQLDGQALSKRQQAQLSDYVNDNIGEDLGLQTLADQLDVSRSNLSRKFRAATGGSVHGFVLAQRVDRAQTLLRRTRLPMRDVAAQCGFTDASHMNRIFRSKLGITPGQYRRDV